MLTKGGLFGPTAVVFVLFAATGIASAGFTGAGQTLPPTVIVFPTLPCSRPCSLRRLDIVPSCTGAVLES